MNGPSSLFTGRWMRAALSAGLGWLLWSIAPVGEARAQGGPALVVVGPVIERTNIIGGHVFVGSVKPLRHSSVGSAVGGRVVEFHAKQGSAVKEGQPLAKLLTGQIDIQIAAAKAELQLREEELRELRNGSREEDKEAARARMEAAAAVQQYADSKLRRVRQLFERQVVTEDDMLDATRGALAAAHTYAAEKAAYDKVLAGPRPEEIGQAEARAAAAQEEINRLNDLLEKHTIKSPFDGFVVAEHTEIGHWINPGELVAEVVELTEVEVEVPVLERYIARLNLNVEANVELDALSGELFAGRVSAIVPRADERSRSFPVRVKIANALESDGQPRIKPGMFARVWLPVEPKARALLVPKDALVLSGTQRMVYQVVPEGSAADSARVAPVPVELGISAGGWIEISGKLAPGARVVVEGNERLFPGQQVRIVREIPPPAESPATGSRNAVGSGMHLAATAAREN